MAGDWIKMRVDLFTHPKVVRISSALNADTLRTVGGLMSAWCLFDVHTEDGVLLGYTSETLDSYLRWEGFSAAMISVGWLEEKPEGLVLPEFYTHNGKSAKRRAQEADRKRSVRKTSACDADKMRTREEKRREENIKTLEARAPAANGEETSEQKRLRSACMKNREKIIERFNHCETVFDHEVDKMVSYYAQRPIGIDPMYTVLNWFERMKKPEPVKDTSGPYIPKGDDEMYIATMKKMGFWDE